MVHIVVGQFIAVDFSFLCRHGICPCLYILNHFRKIITLGRIHEGLKFQSCSIVPFAFTITSVKIGSVRIPLNLGPDHPH